MFTKTSTKNKYLEMNCAFLLITLLKILQSNPKIHGSLFLLSAKKIASISKKSRFYVFLHLKSRTNLWSSLAKTKILQNNLSSFTITKHTQSSITIKTLFKIFASMNKNLSKSSIMKKFSLTISLFRKVYFHKKWRNAWQREPNSSQKFI